MSGSVDFQMGLDAYDRGDYATALREWKPLAGQGDSSAQYNLGLMYDNGEGVPQDYKIAVKWYRRAAEQGYTNAQNNLGLMYRKGQGVSQDYKTAVKWYRRAAEQGDAYAQHNLGVMYAFGKGVQKDYIYAHMWGNIAASNGAVRKVLDFVEKKMTPSQIAESQKLARECIRKKYKRC